MIYDKIENVLNYKGISKNLDMAFEFISKTDLLSLPLGRTEIEGNNVFVNVMEANANKKENINFEIHNKYIDIQIDIEGIEIVEIGLGNIKELEAIDEKKDIGFYEAESSLACILGPGRFIAILEGEPHKPSIAASEQTFLKKCVFKVAK